MSNDFVGLPKLDKPCTRCGWKYAGFHICFDASKPCPDEGKINPRPKLKPGAKTPEGLKKISMTTSARWEEYREQFQTRDQEIVDLYKAGDGLRVVAEKFGISHSTVIKVIRRAEAMTGETIMRPRGLIYKYAK